MSAIANTRFLTADEFAKLPDPVDGSKQELVRGEVVAMAPPSFLHGVVQIDIGFALRAYANKHKVGESRLKAE
jgi:Uma2 family endonuclease